MSGVDDKSKEENERKIRNEIYDINEKVRNANSVMARINDIIKKIEEKHSYLIKKNEDIKSIKISGVFEGDMANILQSKVECAKANISCVSNKVGDDIELLYYQIEKIKSYNESLLSKKQNLLVRL